MKKAPALSVGAIGFAIVIIALDFAVIRAACLSPRPVERASPGAPVLPGMLAGRLLSRGPDGRAVFAFFLLPMINALLIRRLPFVARKSHGRDRRVRHRRRRG